MKKIYSLVVLALLGWLYLPTAEAQQQEVKRRIDAPNGTPAFIEFNVKGKDASNLRADQAKNVLRTYLNLSEEEDLQSAGTVTDQLGMTHHRYNQYFGGIKVEHGSYTAHTKNGLVHTINGEIKKINKLNTTPGLSEEEALKRALNFVGAQTYMWEIPAQERWIKEEKNDRNATFRPKGELVIVENRLAKDKERNGALVLAYKFDIYAEAPLSRDYIYVDANTGEVVFKDAIIKHATATGSAATRYSGTQTIKTDSYNGSYRLRDYTRGNGIETYNCKTGTSYSAAVDFTDNDNTWSAAEFDNTAKDNAGLDAHWAAQMTYDYFLTKHNRNSFDGNGAKIKSYVHYNKNYENAFWNGSVMTYGDGATRFDALTSLDVGAHEIGHAVCTNTANLVYSYESGAMNEGFSDIWAACVEAFAAPNKSIWLIGEDIDKQRPSLRSMSNPNAESQPDTYKGDYWYTGSGDNGGVHTNSGVLNHWFYILSVGKSGTNDKGTSFNVTGIGIESAARIAYRTESVYLTSNSVYADARNYSIQAAIDIFGEGSNEVIQTTNAWNAVGIGGKYGEISYCTSQGNNSSYEWIASVKIGSFTKTSGAAGYSDFTGTTVELAPGSSNAVTLTPGFASTAYNEYWKIWIDYNKDGDFNDAGELAFDAGSLSKTAVNGTINIPSSASGKTRMRVSMKYNAAQSVCESFSYGEVEDYSVSFSGSAPTCAVPGSLTASSITSSSATLSWGAVSGASSYNVRYRATGASSWTATTSTSTSKNVTGLAANTQYEFQVSTVCSGTSSSYSVSSTFTTTSGTISYCASKGNNSSYEWIDLVQVGTISKTSGNDGGYKDYTSTTFTMARGASTTVNFSAGFSSSSYNEYWRIWIDFNQDGDFADAGEQVVSGNSSSSGTLSGDVAVPATALLGTTRMRVSMKYNSAQGPCDSFAYGEVEDYTVNIVNTVTSSMAATSVVTDAEPLGESIGSDYLAYPNPANNFIRINSTSNKLHVRIVNVAGVEIQSAKLTRAGQKLDVSGLAAGMYIIKVNDGQKEMQQRFIKE